MCVWVLFFFQCNKLISWTRLNFFQIWCLFTLLFAHVCFLFLFGCLLLKEDASFAVGPHYRMLQSKQASRGSKTNSASFLIPFRNHQELWVSFKSDNRRYCLPFSGVWKQNRSYLSCVRYIHAWRLYNQYHMLSVNFLVLLDMYIILKHFW